MICFGLFFYPISTIPNIHKKHTHIVHSTIVQTHNNPTKHMHSTFSISTLCTNHNICCIYHCSYINCITNQLLVSLLRCYEPYNSSPLVSTDMINKLQGFMLFTHFANSAGLSRQCSKGPQDSLQELSLRRAQAEVKPARRWGVIRTCLKQPGSLPSTNKVLKASQTWPRAFYMVALCDFLNHNSHNGGQQWCKTLLLAV